MEKPTASSRMGLLFSKGGLAAVIIVFIFSFWIVASLTANQVSAVNPNVYGVNMDATAQDLTVPGFASAGQRFGEILVGIGDVNNDGNDDFATASPLSDDSISFDPDGPDSAERPQFFFIDEFETFVSFNEMNLHGYAYDAFEDTYAANVNTAYFLFTSTNTTDSTLSSITWDDGFDSGSPTLICSDTLGDYSFAVYYVHGDSFNPSNALGDGVDFTLNYTNDTGQFAAVATVTEIESGIPIDDFDCATGTGNGAMPTITDSTETDLLLTFTYADATANYTSGIIPVTAYYTVHDSSVFYAIGSRAGEASSYTTEWLMDPQFGNYQDWFSSTLVLNFGSAGGDPQFDIASATNERVLGIAATDDDGAFINIVSGPSSFSTVNQVDEFAGDLGILVESGIGAATRDFDFDQTIGTTPFVTGGVSLRPACGGPGTVFNLNDIGAFDYGYNSYDDNFAEEFYADPGEDLSTVYVTFDLATDDYPEEGGVYLESPLGTIWQIADGNSYSSNSYTSVDESTTDFDGEDSDGTWILRAEDSYGDGGTGVENIEITFGGATITELCPGESAPVVNGQGNAREGFVSSAYSSIDLQAFGENDNLYILNFLVYEDDNGNDLVSTAFLDGNDSPLSGVTEHCTVTDQGITLTILGAYPYYDFGYGFHSLEATFDGTMDSVDIESFVVERANQITPVGAAVCAALTEAAPASGYIAPVFEDTNVSGGVPHTMVSGTSTSFSYNVPSVTNSLLVVNIDSGAILPSSVTYDGVSLTLVCGAGTSGFNASMYYMVNPSTGSNTLQVNFPGTADNTTISASVFSGIDQSSPLADSSCAALYNPWSAAFGSYDVSQQVTTGSNYLIVANMDTYSDGTVLTPYAGMTELFNTVFNINGFGAAGYKISSSDPESLGWDLSREWPLGVAVASFKPSTSAAPPPNVPAISTGGGNSGTLRVFYGGSSVDNAVDATFIGEEVGEQIGRSDFSTLGGEVIAAIGDVDGDGVDDFALGSPSNDSDTGKVYIYLGGTVWATENSVLAANATLIGEAAGDKAGFSVAGIGDINGDGYDDIAIGAPFRDQGGTNNGEVYVVYGRATGSWSADMALSAMAPSYLGNESNDRIGMYIEGFGDIGGDPKADFGIGAPFADYKNLAVNTGILYVEHGNTTGNLGAANQNVRTGTTVQIEGEEDNDNLGMGLTALEDFNADGIPDVVVGAPGHSTNISDDGSIYLLYGDASGNWGTNDIDFVDDANWIGSCNGCRLGEQLTSLDWDGDGNGDIVSLTAINAVDTDNEVYVIFGQGNVVWTANRDLGAQFFGSFNNPGINYIAGIGDINADGFDDLGFGMPVQGSFGAAYVSYGATAPAVVPTGLASNPGTVVDVQIVEKQDGNYLVHFGLDDTAVSGELDNYFVSCQDATCSGKVNTNGVSTLYSEAISADFVDFRFGTYMWVDSGTGLPRLIGRNSNNPDTLMTVASADTDFSSTSVGVLSVVPELGGSNAQVFNIKGVTRTADGHPFIVWGCGFGCGGNLYGMRCLNNACSSSTVYTLDTPAVATTDNVQANWRNAAGGKYGYTSTDYLNSGMSVALIAGDIPIIAKYNYEINGLELITCNNQDCSTRSKRTLVTGDGPEGTTGAFGIPGQILIRADGTPAIPYRADNDGNGSGNGFELRLYSCDNATCTSGSDYSVYDTEYDEDNASGAIGGLDAMWLDENNNPNFYTSHARGDEGASDADFNLYKCYNTNCTEGRFRRLKDETEVITNPSDVIYNSVTGRFTFAYVRAATASNWEAHLFNTIPAFTSSISNLPGTLEAKQISRVDDANALLDAIANPEAQNFSTAVTDIRIQTTGDIPIADLEVTFNEDGDLDWSSVLGESSLSGKAVVNIIGEPGVGTTHTLYIPKLPLQTAVVICPGATTLGQVTVACAGNYTVTEGTTGVSIVSIGGINYWKIEGLTGTGGLGIGNTLSTYIDLTPEPATTPPNINAAPEIAVSTNDQFYMSYVPDTTEFGIGDTADVVVPQDFDNLAICAGTGDADGDATTDHTVAIIDNQIIRYTFTQPTTIALATGVEFCFDVDSAPTPGNFSIAISDDNDGNFSAALIYVGDDNDITLTATIPSTLSLRIKESSTTTDTNACNLGALNPGSLNSCSYRIAAGTNISTGIEVYILSDGVLSTLAGGGGDTIDDTPGSTDVVAGIEGHGVVMSLGGGFTLGGTFSTSLDNPVPTAETLLVDAAAAVSDSIPSNWTTITHHASVNSSTNSGSYTQIVSYRAWAGT